MIVYLCLFNHVKPPSSSQYNSRTIKPPPLQFLSEHRTCTYMYVIVIMTVVSGLQGYTQVAPFLSGTRA